MYYTIRKINWKTLKSLERISYKFGVFWHKEYIIQGEDTLLKRRFNKNYYSFSLRKLRLNSDTPLDCDFIWIIDIWIKETSMEKQISIKNFIKELHKAGIHNKKYKRLLDKYYTNLVEYWKERAGVTEHQYEFYELAKEAYEKATGKNFESLTLAEMNVFLQELIQKTSVERGGE